MYLKQVDQFADLKVHCLITPSNAKLLLLHENEHEDKIKLFFNEAYDLFIKALMNPFYDSTQKMNLPEFHVRVKAVANRIF
jgi:hypothetical protein